MKNNKIMLVLLIMMILSTLGITGYYWYNNTFYVRTDDARVDGTIYKATPRVNGKIKSVEFEEGDHVQAGQVLARLDEAQLPPGTDPELAVVKAPVDGIIIKKLANPNENTAAGATIALLVDPRQMYISANVEETDLSRVKLGQLVDVTLDYLPGQKFTGRVYYIGEASLATFSLLPITNTSGNFTKVVQRIPIKIALDNPPGNLIHNANAEIKIHVR
ncbi:MAG: HlyD family secretion protein [Bacillota bacterium]|uniref:HlyD family secretion protein n=1 Tax=Desulfurispora thermophila TaxID=265470 RepID=UPI00036B71F4|nr:efflux RND transporter periplasmic adaptor subunit [Desulfurispora thermophila]